MSIRITANLRRQFALGLTNLSLLLSGFGIASAADFSVGTPNAQFAFAITNSSSQFLGNSATLTLVRGRTYTFAVSTTGGFHPFRVNSPGVVNNSITSGTLTYTVPTTAANYYYDCGLHGETMRGEIVTVPPPTPPVPRIVSYTIGSNIVLRSAPTTNTFALVPEYKTNLSSSNWLPLTVLSNRFLTGTSETFCGRPPGTNVFIRIRAGGP